MDRAARTGRSVRLTGILYQEGKNAQETKRRKTARSDCAQGRTRRRRLVHGQIDRDTCPKRNFAYVLPT